MWLQQRIKGTKLLLSQNLHSKWGRYTRNIQIFLVVIRTMENNVRGSECQAIGGHDVLYTRDRERLSALLGWLSGVRDDPWVGLGKVYQQWWS